MRGTFWLARMPTTTLVGLEGGGRSPREFVAETRTSSVLPPSAAPASYVNDVAPGTAWQPVPFAPQRSHWYAYPDGSCVPGALGGGEGLAHQGDSG